MAPKKRFTVDGISCVATLDRPTSLQLCVCVGASKDWPRQRVLRTADLDAVARDAIRKASGGADGASTSTSGAIDSELAGGSA